MLTNSETNLLFRPFSLLPILCLSYALAGCDSAGDSSLTYSTGESLLTEHSGNNISANAIPRTAAASGNLLLNPGFETGSASWEACGSRLDLRPNQDSTEGNSALEVTAGNCVQQFLRLAAGVSYEFFCDAKIQSDNGWTGLGLSFYDENLAFIDESVQRVDQQSYQKYTASLSSPSDSYLTLVWLYTDDGALLDNCSLLANGETSGNLISYSREEIFIERDSRDDIVFSDRTDGDLQVRVGTSADTIEQAVYVSRWNGSQWVENWTVTVPDYDIWSADVSNNRLAIGAIRNSENTGGAVFIYDLVDDEWQMGHTVTLPSVVTNPIRDLNERIQFGSSVAISGDYLTVGAARRPTGALSSGYKGAEINIFEFNGNAWNAVFQDNRTHQIWEVMNPYQWYEPEVEINDRRAVMSHILGPILYLRENGAWSTANINHNYSFIGETDVLLNSGLGYLVHSHDEAINLFFDPSLKFFDNQLRVYHHYFDSNVCPFSLVYGCRAPAPIHIFNFDDQTPDSSGSTAQVVRLNVWNEAAANDANVPETEGRGYIATYRCTLEEEAPNGVEIDFNYKGPSKQISSWMLTYIGDVETGNFGSGGTFAMRPSSNVQAFTAGDTLEFEFLATDASFINHDFNVRCNNL